MVHDGDAVAQPLGLFHIVGGQEHRVAARAELADDVPQLAAGLGIEAGRRLIEEQQLGAADQRARDGEPLFLPAGERAHAGAAFLLELYEGEHFVHGVGAPVETTEQLHRFRDGEFVPELRVLELDAEALAQGPPAVAVVPVHAQHLHRSRIGEGEAFEDFDGGGLAGAVGAEEAEAFADLDGQIEPRHRDDVAEALDQPRAMNRRHVRRRA